jgi:hypothetical protein
MNGRARRSHEPFSLSVVSTNRPNNCAALEHAAARPKHAIGATAWAASPTDRRRGSRLSCLRRRAPRRRSRLWMRSSRGYAEPRSAALPALHNADSAARQGGLSGASSGKPNRATVVAGPLETAVGSRRGLGVIADASLQSSRWSPSLLAATSPSENVPGVKEAHNRFFLRVSAAPFERSGARAPASPRERQTTSRFRPR